MMASASEHPNVAIACGGTGGHLFPGLAVARQLAGHGVKVTLMISPKEVDQLAVKGADVMNVVTLPAVGLTRGHRLAFLQGFVASYRAALVWFRQNSPRAALAMGGFTSAPPILAAKRMGAATFLHESNSIPGRANRWLSWIVTRAFVGFPSAAGKLHTRRVSITGTPVRPKFVGLDVAACRRALGLDPARPVVLVMGGSQGAHGINELVLNSLPMLTKEGPDWQWVHLAGAADVAELTKAYQACGLQASVHAFSAQMEQVMGAATTGISRAGASSLAELAAVGLPAVLIPFPAATDNHQFYNARAFEQTGAAVLLDQQTTRPEDLCRQLRELMRNDNVRRSMQNALAKWHTPQAAEQIAQAIVQSVHIRARRVASSSPVRDQRRSQDERTERSLIPIEPASGQPLKRRPQPALSGREAA